MSQSLQVDFMFVSLYTHGREPLLKGQEAKRLMLTKLGETKSRFHLTIAAYVLLDDHIHLLFSSQGNECSAIVNHLRAGMQKDLRLGGMLREDAQVWEHGIKTSVVRKKDELRDYLDFIHYDPVRHGLVQRPADYKWSSLPSRVEQGHYMDNWGEAVPPAGVARVLRPLAEMQ